MTIKTDTPITPDNNPLLDFSGLARFDAIRPEHVTPAVDTLLAKAGALVTELEAPMAQVTWANFVEPLENATEQLGRAWSIVGHLNSVVDTPQLRARLDRLKQALIALAEASDKPMILVKELSPRAGGICCGIFWRWKKKTGCCVSAASSPMSW